jgi:hypothetical protein
MYSFCSRSSIGFSLSPSSSPSNQYQDQEAQKSCKDCAVGELSVPHKMHLATLSSPLPSLLYSSLASACNASHLKLPVTRMLSPAHSFHISTTSRNVRPSSGYYRSSNSAQRKCPKGSRCPGNCGRVLCGPGYYQDKEGQTGCKGW